MYRQTDEIRKPGNHQMEIHGAQPSLGPDPIQTSGIFWQMDILEALPLLTEQWRERIQLIYMDPPFFTGQNFTLRRTLKTKEAPEGQVLRQHAYSDQWLGGRETYMSMMEQVLRGVHALLHEQGSLYLHLDYRSAAYVRVLMDKIFGEDNFRNEIVWHYKSGGRAKKHYSRKHDTLLFYSKSKEYYFDIDAVGVPRGSAKRNNMKRQVDEDGRLFWSIHTAGKEYRYYEDAKVYPSDVWDDISHLQQKDPERTGYDTQKPEALLNRVILASSRPGDWVADFFAGSGTTLASARKLGRSFIGVDNGPFSLQTCRKRLTQIQGGPICFCHEGMLVKDMPDSLKLRHHISDESHLQVMLEANTQFSEVPLLDRLDYWAVGRIFEDCFYPGAAAYRERDGKALPQSLMLPVAPWGEPAVHIVDIEGHQMLLRLPKE